MKSVRPTPLTTPTTPKPSSTPLSPQSDCNSHSVLSLQKSGGMFFSTSDFLTRLSESIERCERGDSRSTPSLTMSSDKE